MSEFEFFFAFFAFFGLIFGLIVAEVAIKFADAIDGHSHRPIGILSPMLALFVLCDVTGYWMFIWSIRDAVYISFGTVILALAVAIAYFLSAALIFPRSENSWATLDEHFWARKRYVLSGILRQLPAGWHPRGAIDAKARRLLVLLLASCLFRPDRHALVFAQQAGQHRGTCHSGRILPLRCAQRLPGLRLGPSGKHDPNSRFDIGRPRP